MFNKGKLTGFGWATVGKYDYSKHTEYPPLSALNVIKNDPLSSQINLSIFILVIFGTCTNLYAR